MNILLTGSQGQVGWELQRTLAPLGQVCGFDRSGLDLADPDAIRRVVRDVAPGLIVNAAAYTAVDKAEAEPDQAMAINAIAPGVLAEAARRGGAAIVHYSTDYVFDGEKKEPYREDDTPRPLGAYGRSKLAGEDAVRASGAPYLVLRTSWVYGARGRNFLLTMLRLARERDELRVVDDQFGAPTWSRMIAQATALALARCPLREAGPDLSAASGVYHLSAAGRTSWHGFARAILERAAALEPGALRAQRVAAIGTTDYPTPAARPRNSVLSNAKLQRAFGIALPAWEDSLARCMEEAARTG